MFGSIVWRVATRRGTSCIGRHKLKTFAKSQKLTTNRNASTTSAPLPPVNSFYNNTLFKKFVNKLKKPVTTVIALTAVGYAAYHSFRGSVAHAQESEDKGKNNQSPSNNAGGSSDKSRTGPGSRYYVPDFDPSFNPVKYNHELFQKHFARESALEKEARVANLLDVFYVDENLQVLSGQTEQQHAKNTEPWYQKPMAWAVDLLERMRFLKHQNSPDRPIYIDRSFKAFLPPKQLPPEGPPLSIVVDLDILTIPPRNSNEPRMKRNGVDEFLEVVAKVAELIIHSQRSVLIDADAMEMIDDKMYASYKLYRENGALVENLWPNVTFIDLPFMNRDLDKLVYLGPDKLRAIQLPSVFVYIPPGDPKDREHPENDTVLLDIIDFVEELGRVADQGQGMVNILKYFADKDVVSFCREFKQQPNRKRHVIELPLQRLPKIKEGSFK